MNVHSHKNHIFMNVHSLKNHTFMNLSPLAIILPINPTLLIREKKSRSEHLRFLTYPFVKLM